MPRRPRIALISAVTVALEPVRDAFAQGWAEAELVNILDDSLLKDRERDGTLTEAMIGRFVALASYAHRLEAHAILFTCSAFGAAIEAAAARVPIPVLKPNEAMFDAALALGDRITMLATSSVAAASLAEEFRSLPGMRPSVRLEVVTVPAAMEALRAGDGGRFGAILAERAASLRPPDVFMLAHFSTAVAAPAVRRVTAAPVLTAPDTAVARLRARLAPEF